MTTSNQFGQAAQAAKTEQKPQQESSKGIEWTQQEIAQITLDARKEAQGTSAFMKKFG